MKKLINPKVLIAVICIVYIAALCAAAFSYYTPTFQGSRVKNPDAYLLDIKKMNGDDSHVLELKEGDILQVQFETVKGSLQMEIRAEDGSTVYSGNGQEHIDFQLRIPRDGAYTIVINARKAKGTIHIMLMK